MFTAAFPAFVTVICFWLFVPTATVPKLMLAGLAVNCPLAGLDPVPLSPTVSGEFDASLLTVIVPAKLPATAGANVAVKVAVCAGFKVTGTDSPLTV